MTFKKIILNWKVLLLLGLILLSLLAIGFNPSAKGVAIRSVATGSAADVAGIPGVDASIRPTDREVISAINGQTVLNEDDFFALTNDISIGQNFIIKTNKATYTLVAQPLIQSIITDDTTFVNVTIFNETTGVFEVITQEMPVVLETVIGVEDLGLTIYDAPTSNVRKGLDLQGGTRVILQPDTPITNDQFESIKVNLEQRLNVFGLSDVIVSVVNDFQFNPQYIMVEIAGSTVSEVESLVLSQGKFEAKIGDVVVFNGEKHDIVYVGKSPSESGISQCSRITDGYQCGFVFSIRLSPTAAKRHADITDTLTVFDGYLSQPLDLYLDDELVSSLQISSSLKGQNVADIQISGAEVGFDEFTAQENALAEMKQLQTVIETGSLPTTLSVVKSDTISPVLGKNFSANALLVGILALITVSIIMFIRYRSFKYVVPQVVALISEVILILGFASFAGWTLDLAGIAGIIISVGTGVDHMIIITDEVRRKSVVSFDSWKTKIGKAFGIVFGAALTTTFAMVPLLFAGAGLLKGFAIMTLLGLVVGVVIVRPTYAKVIEILHA